MSDSATKPDAGRRGAAAAALVAGVLALIAVVAFAVGSFGHIAMSLVGTAVAVTGGWYFVASRGAKRVIAGVIGLVGAVVAIVALLSAGASLWALPIAAVLVGLSVYLAKVATNAHVETTAADMAAPHAPAQRPVLIMNPWSGGGKVAKFNLVDECKSRGIEPVVLTQGDDLVQLAEDAVGRGADVIGMAGGDGSQALVATVASKHGLPHVVIPAGTRNHLALDLGIDRDDVVGSLDAYAGGIPKTVDLATVNGRVFVNNVSLGLYADIVKSDAYRDAKLRTALDTLPDLLGSNADSLDLHFVDGEGAAHDTADVVLVSNNPYDLESLGGLGTRARMDTGELGLLSVTIDSAVDARRFLALESAGRADSFPGWVEWSTPRFELNSSGPVALGVDGESMSMDPPIVFEMMPGALTVLLPPQAPGSSPAARKSTVPPKELWDIALGRE